MARRNRHQRGISIPDTRDLNREFAKQTSIEIWHFVKRNAPLAHGKPNGQMFFIDSESAINALIVTGRRLYADEVRGFSAPINKREPTRRHPVQIYDGVWRMVDTKTKFGNAGVYIHDVSYYGERKIANGYFGVKRDGEVRAYGIDQDSKALPAYSISLPEWLVIEQGAELSRIINETFEKVFQRQLSVA